MPRQGSLKEVDEHIDNALQIISATLLDTQMAVDRCIAWGTGEALVIFIRNMISVFLDVLLGQSEINHEYFAAVLMRPNQEILRLDIPMNELFGMDILQPCDDLLANKNDGLQIELSVAFLEEIFDGGSKKIHNHDIVLLILAVVINPWQSDIIRYYAFVEIGQ